MGKVKDTMRQIGIRNRLKTPLDNAQCMIQWLSEYQPKALTNYQKSEFYKILTRTNKYESVLEAMHFLHNEQEKDKKRFL